MNEDRYSDITMGYIFFNSYGEGRSSEEYEGVLRGD